MNAKLPENMLNLENELGKLFKPVQPDPVFINRLQGQLVRPRTVMLEENKTGVALLIAGAGIFTGALLIWLLKRITG